MPFVEGESLRDRLEREAQLPIDAALQITREVADALAYAHSRGVIHHWADRPGHSGPALGRSGCAPPYRTADNTTRGRAGRSESPE